MTKRIQKKIKRIFAFVTLTALTLSLLSLSCFADTADIDACSVGEPDDAAIVEQSGEEVSESSGEYTPNEDASAENTSSAEDGENAENGVTGEDLTGGNDNIHSEVKDDPGEDFIPQDEGNFFLFLYEGVMDNISEIFSLFSFIGTLVIAFIYKKGLLPLFSKTVTGLKDGIGAIKEESESALSAGGQKIDLVRDKLSEIENTFSLFSESVTSLESKLAAEEALASERKKLEIIMGSQIDLLYDIFMSSSLPEYKKEAVGAKFLQMREELKKNELTAEEK